MICKEIWNILIGRRVFYMLENIYEYTPRQIIHCSLSYAVRKWRILISFVLSYFGWYVNKILFLLSSTPCLFVSSHRSDWSVAWVMAIFFLFCFVLFWFFFLCLLLYVHDEGFLSLKRDRVHRRMSLLSLSLLLQQSPTCLVCLTWMVCKMRGKWQYSCSFVELFVGYLC